MAGGLAQAAERDAAERQRTLGPGEHRGARRVAGQPRAGRQLALRLDELPEVVGEEAPLDRGHRLQADGDVGQAVQRLGALVDGRAIAVEPRDHELREPAHRIAPAGLVGRHARREQRRGEAGIADGEEAERRGQTRRGRPGLRQLQRGR